jgi:hypothetical protein
MDGQRRRPNYNRSWTKEEDDTLRTMVAAGKSILLISARLKRTSSAVKSRANTLRKMSTALGSEQAEAKCPTPSTDGYHVLTSRWTT